MKILSLLLLLVPCFRVVAQPFSECSQQRSRHPLAKSTLASPLLDSYDVKWVKLDLQLSNLSTSVSGNATTKAVVTAPPGLSTYVFELSSQLTVDSVLINGVPRAAIAAGTNLQSVALAAPVPAGTLFNAQVFYHGTTTNGTGFFTRGLNHYHLPSGTDITFSLSDPNLARDWWPCKQSLTDKIDSAELWFTAPIGTMVGSNGLLTGTTLIGSGSRRWEWKTKYPIDYYLICASVAPYAAHTQMLHFTGSSDSMPVVHYVYDTATFNPMNGAAIDSTPYMVDYFSSLYGRYPFWKEKYGHCIAPLGGGMEHQTMTTLGAFTTPLIAHELGHQWWGDCVTYGSWRDIWLSEGFASYTEQLYVEHFRGIAAAKDYRTGVFNNVMAGAGGSVYVDDTTDVYRIFDSRLTYNKGAAVAHMLRFIAPGDAAFFSGLRAFQQQYAFKNATTADFQTVMETAYGRRLDTFFNQWVYGEGYPSYTQTYVQRGSDVWVKLVQIGSKPASVAAFALPVPLLLHSNAGDTLVTVYLNTPSAVFHFIWNKSITDVLVDPDNNIVNLAQPFADIDESLGTASVMPEQSLRITPNPANGRWEVSGISPGASLQLRDAGGKILWERKAVPARVSIECSALPAGIYSLCIFYAAGDTITRKLEKL